MQQCPDCGSPLRPCRCERPTRRRAWNSTLPASTGLKRSPDRYGPAFEAVKRLPCVLWTLAYYGPGHECCGFGAQGGHTAHHVGRLDSEGLLPVCGKAHDMIAGRGGEKEQEAFQFWLATQGHDLHEIALRYYEEAA